MVENKKTAELSVSSDLEKTVSDFVKSNLMEFVIKDKKFKISPKAKERFITHCMINKLNPLKWEVYWVPFYDQEHKTYDIQPIISYKTFVKKAQESWLLDWMFFEKLLDSDWKFEWWKVTIHRKDWSKPFIDELTYKEAVKRDKQGSPVNYWPRKDMASFMVKKQLIRQALPIVFADVMDWDYERPEVVVEEVPDNSSGIIDWIVESI